MKLPSPSQITTAAHRLRATAHAALAIAECLDRIASAAQSKGVTSLYASSHGHEPSPIKGPTTARCVRRAARRA